MYLLLHMTEEELTYMAQEGLLRMTSEQANKIVEQMLWPFPTNAKVIVRTDGSTQTVLGKDENGYEKSFPLVYESGESRIDDGEYSGSQFKSVLLADSKDWNKYVKFEKIRSIPIK